MSIRWTNANNAAFLGVTIAFGVVALALTLGFFGEWREPECDSLPVQSVASPSGALRAMQEQEACRSTGRLHTTVIVRQAGKADGTLVFGTTTGNALGAMSVGQRSLPLTLVWKSENELFIGHPAEAKPDAASASGSNLKVMYSAQSPR